MRFLTRTGAFLSFLFCFLSGVFILTPALSVPKEDGFLMAALGLFLIGMAFFFGSMIWLTGEHLCAKQDTKRP